jgi:tight adherence protein C
MTLALVTAFFLFVGGTVAGAGLCLMRWRPAAGEAEDGPGILWRLLVRLGEKAPSPRHDPAAERKRLFQAGFRGPHSMAFWRGVRWTSAGGLGLLTLAMVSAARGEPAAALLPAVCAGGLGYLAPRRVLEWRTRTRRGRIRAGLPAAVDLLVLATEAGQSLDQAMRDTAHSLAEIYPELASELIFCMLEMRAGKGRAESLRHLAERSSEPELARLAHLLLDGERFGTSLGPALRNHARFLRTRMRHAVQEKARKLGVKLVFPVFFLIFPSVLLVTLGPAYLMTREFLGNFLK